MKKKNQLMKRLIDNKNNTLLGVIFIKSIGLHKKKENDNEIK